MAETIRRVDYFYVTAPNKPGEGVRMLNTLKEAGISLLAFSGFPSGRRSQIDFVPEDTAAFRKAARKAGWKLSPRKTGFLVEGKDQLGALLNVVSRLALLVVLTAVIPIRGQSVRMENLSKGIRIYFC